MGPVHGVALERAEQRARTAQRLLLRARPFEDATAGRDSVGEVERDRPEAGRVQASGGAERRLVGDEDVRLREALEVWAGRGASGGRLTFAAAAFSTSARQSTGRPSGPGYQPSRMALVADWPSSRARSRGMSSSRWRSAARSSLSTTADLRNPMTDRQCIPPPAPWDLFTDARRTRAASPRVCADLRLPPGPSRHGDDADQGALDDLGVPCDRRSGLEQGAIRARACAGGFQEAERAQRLFGERDSRGFAFVERDPGACQGALEGRERTGVATSRRRPGPVPAGVAMGRR